MRKELTVWFSRLCWIVFGGGLALWIQATFLREPEILLRVKPNFEGQYAEVYTCYLNAEGREVLHGESHLFSFDGEEWQFIRYEHYRVVEIRGSMWKQSYPTERP
jgi:hypothetical protein